MTKRTRWIVAIGTGTVLLVLGALIIGRGPTKSAYTLAVVRKMDLVEKASVTGRVVAAENLDLAFEKSGKVERVATAVGDVVRAGQVLVALDRAELDAQFAQATASVDSARAGLTQFEQALAREQVGLAELERGTRSEELAVAASAVRSAEQAATDAIENVSVVEEKARVDLQNLYDGVSDIITDAVAKGDDTLSKQVDEMFDNDASSHPTVTFSTNPQSAINAEAGRVTAGEALAALKELTRTAPPPPTALEWAGRSLSKIEALVAALTDAVNAATNLTLTTRATYASNLNTARTNLNAVTAAINRQQQLIRQQEAVNQSALASSHARRNDADGALTQAQANLALKVAGSSSEQISAQMAKVKQAEANRTSQVAAVKEAEARQLQVDAQLRQRVLLSPIDGQVTRQDARVGEIIAANTPIATVVSSGTLNIEAHVAEADIAKVHTGAEASVTLDAYPSGVVFRARVVSVDPSGVIIDGVATYKTTLTFADRDERVKPGMTANVDIVSGKSIGALAVPARAIIKRDGKYFLKRSRAGTIDEIEVSTGLTDSSGNVEILDGVHEGDTIIIS